MACLGLGASNLGLNAWGLAHAAWDLVNYQPSGHASLGPNAWGLAHAAWDLVNYQHSKAVRLLTPSTPKSRRSILGALRPQTS